MIGFFQTIVEFLQKVLSWITAALNIPTLISSGLGPLSVLNQVPFAGPLVVMMLTGTLTFIAIDVVRDFL